MMSNMFKVNFKNTRTTSDIVLVLLLLTLNMFSTFSSVPIVEFEQVNVSGELTTSRLNIFLPVKIDFLHNTLVLPHLVR